MAKPPPPSERLRWCGFVLVLVPLLLRASTPNTQLPSWDMDPLNYPLRTPALGPAGSMLCDVLSLLGVALLLTAETMSQRRISRALCGLALIGTAACVAHAWWLPSPDSAAITGSLGNQRIGMAWIAGIWSAMAFAHAARDDRVRRAGIGVLLAFIALLALRGMQEVFIDHPVMMEAYRADPRKFVESRGWTVDSSMARQFVRRVSQPEASGWFALSNVYASFAAFGVVGSASWLLGVLRARQAGSGTGPLAAAAVSLALSSAALYLSDSKGGVAFAAFGLVLLAAGSAASGLGSRRPWVRSLVGPGCIAMVLGAIAVRGLVGERIRELSVLFRSQYIEAAIRIFAANPAGVGPDGFQPAYLLAKNPLNPEEVQSPHSILFDWIATLGIAGIAWCAALVIASVFIGRGLFAGDGRDLNAGHVPSDSRAGKAAMLTIAAATIGAAWMQSPLITIDTALVRVGGMIIGSIVAFVMAGSTLGGEWTRRGLAAGALALLAHAQFDVTMSLPTAAGLALVACGLAAAPSLAGAAVGGVGKTGLFAAGALIVVALGAAWAGCLPAWRWQSKLDAAAAEARVVTAFAERLSLQRTGATSPLYPRDSVDKILAELSAETGRSFARTDSGVESALLELDRRRLGRAAETLGEAMAIQPGEWRVAREACRLHLRIASGYLHSQQPSEADLAADRGVRVLSPPMVNGAPSASAAWLRALAVAEEGYGRQRTEPAWLKRAHALLQQVASIDPYNLDVAMRLFRLNRLLGFDADGKKWAGRAIELDELARLDREARGLTPAERSELDAVAR